MSASFYSSGPIPSIEEIGDPITSPIPPGSPDLIPGFLPSSGQLLIAGSTNVGKSLVALEVCSSLITGSPLWGSLQPTHQVDRIIYILGEHYNEVIKRLWLHTGLPMTDQVILLGPEQLALDKWLVSNGKLNPLAEEKLIKWTEGAGLIVFDPLAAFISGAEAENDNVQMRLLLDRMSYIAQKSEAASLILAHQGKPSIGKDGEESVRKSYAIRGASAVEDAATNIFYMNRIEGNAAVAETVNSKVFSLKCRKYKGESVDEFKLVRNPVNLTHTLLGNRPFVEVRRIELQSKIGRLALQHPNLSTIEIIRILAATEGVSESTIRRSMENV